MPIAPDNLIPPDSELAQLLLQWSETEDTRTWNIANLTNDLIEELEGGIATETDIYKAVAKRCKGRKWNTIRRIAQVAADFPRDIQDQYASLLSFEHFKVSRRLFNEGVTPHVSYALQWCVEGNDNKLNAGKFHTVGEILHHFLPEETFQKNLKKFWNGVKDKLYDHILMHEHDIERSIMMEGYQDIDSIVSNLKMEVS